MAKIVDGAGLVAAADRKQELKLLQEERRLTNAEATELDNIIQDIYDYRESVAVPGVSSQSRSGGNPAGLNSNIHVWPPTAEQMEHDLGVAFQCQILSNLDHKPAAVIAKKHFNNDRVSAAAMYADEHGAGGSWIMGAYSDRFIERLLPMSIIRMIGADSLPLDDGVLVMAKETGGPSGEYLGEKETADNEIVSTGDVRLIAKELVVQVTATEKLLRSPSANASARILNSILRGAGATEDLYFLRGSASGAGPTGLRYQVHADNIIPVNASVTLANVTNDLGKAELALLDANVTFYKPAWLMAPRTLIYLMDLRDSNGNLAWPSLQNAKPMLRNKPVYTTTQIPTNLGAGNESEIMLIEATHIVIGDAPRISLESSNVAAYNDGGTVKAAFSERKVVTRLVMENDIAALHDKAIAVLTEVDWGA